MSETFIFSIDDEVRDSCFLTTEEVFGLTGHNTGNLAFHHAMVKVLGGPQMALPWHAATDKINLVNKIGVMPCANQLGPHVDFGRLAERFEKLSIPLVAVGLGAQGQSDYGDLPEVPAGTISWVREIAKRSPRGGPNIGVRGPFTLSVLGKYGLADSAIVTGCPSLFLSADPLLGQKIEERSKRPFDRVAVAAGHQGWKHLAPLEHSLVKIMEQTGGAYVVQSPIEMVSLARGESSLISSHALEACREYIRPDLTLSDFETWYRRYFRVFFSVSGWMEFFLSFDFVVGARIHGVMLALQAGIPGLCIAHDSRTREMCEVMRVPFVMARDVRDGLSHSDLRSKFVFDGKAFDENRRLSAIRFNNFLESNCLPASQWLAKVAGGSPPSSK